MKFHRAIDYNLKKTLKELRKQDIGGLESILQKIERLNELETYGKMYEGSVLGKRIFASDAQLISNGKNQNSLLTIGFKNLGKFPFYIPPFSDLISFNYLNALYTVILLVYYANVKRELGYNDIQNVYLSGLDNRIIHAMDEFEKTSNVPETDEEYLMSLKSLRWENSDAKKLFKKLNYMKSIICQERFRINYQIGIQRAEDKFILFAAGCSAVNSERDKINENDIIKGYKTYFKLINTDITKYKAISNLKIGVENLDNGYLVCDKCFEYYKLQPGESPDDFTDECECGGRFKYHDNFDG